MDRGRGLEIVLQADGGVKLDNIASAASTGANSFVAGTSVFIEDDRKKAIDALRTAARAAVR